MIKANSISAVCLDLHIYQKLYPSCPNLAGLGKVTFHLVFYFECLLKPSTHKAHHRQAQAPVMG